MHRQYKCLHSCTVFITFITYMSLVFIQVLKKDLYFDPEFWNLIALRTNCLKLMSEKEVGAALEEIMEEKWVPSYCAKALANTSLGQKGRKGEHQTAGRKRHQKEADGAQKRLKVGPGRPQLEHTAKKKGNQGRYMKDASSEPLRRSFWQLDRRQDSVAAGFGQQRRTTRLSEKNPPKRKIRQPRWLLQDSGKLEENNVPSKIRKHGLRHQKDHHSSGVKRLECGQLKNSAKHRVSVNSHSSKHQRGLSSDCLKPASPQVILELSLPDNELMFTDDACNRQRGYPQMLFYRPTVKLPATSQTVKTVHRKEWVLRARDAAMFVQQLHCYARRQKGKGNVSNTHGSVSTITRSSVQGSPPKDPDGELCEKVDTEMEGGDASAKLPESPVLEKGGNTAINSARQLFEKSETNVMASQASVEAQILDIIPQAQTTEKVSQTVASVIELCEEPAVEMKVTIASQTPTLAKATQLPAVDKINKAQDISTTASTFTAHSSQMDVTADDGDALVNTHQEQQQRSADCRSENGQKYIEDTQMGTILGENTGAECEMSETKVACGPAESDSINLTLVTEMVTEFTSGELARDLENPKPNVSREIRTTSGCPAQEQGAPAVANKEEGVTQDEDPDEDGEQIENEESKLEFSCTFCNKSFKGSRVVGHAMFHFRKDECMFCRTMFKDDLLAMMHLSDHIEKLKKSKESADNKDQQNCVSETKDNPTAKTSAKAKITHMSSGHRSSGRLKKSSVCPDSLSQPDPDLGPSDCRKLRSKDKPADGQILQKKKQLKHTESKSAVHKVNGHIGKKNQRDRMKPTKSEAKQPPAQQRTNRDRTRAVSPASQRTCDVDDDSSATELDPSREVEKKGATKRKAAENNLERVRCPVDGCSWFKDLSKNRVGLLYHALEDHHGDIKPLELSFQVSNSRCSICMRVLWSFEHFQHHVERHRLTPRHPCLHQGCTDRFKSGMEMRRHTRRHSPLQAACCLPGCSKLFICLWALNLHEREHYASKPTKPVKNTNLQTHNKNNSTQGHKAKDATVKKPARNLRGQPSHSSTETNVSVPPPAAAKTSVVKHELKVRHESRDSNVLKNLSNKDTTEQSTVPHLRLRHKLRKATKPNLTAARILQVFSSKLLKRSGKLRHKLKRRQVKVNTEGHKRRGRPPKIKKAVHDENTTAGQSAETVEHKAEELPAGPPETTATPTESSKIEEEEERSQDGGKLTETEPDESKSKKSVKHKGALHHSSTPAAAQGLNQGVTTTSPDKTLLKRRCAPKGNTHNASESFSKAKKRKITNLKVNKKCSRKELDVSAASKQPVTSESVVPPAEIKAAAAVVPSSADEEGKAKVENTDWTQDRPGDSEPAAPSTSGEKTTRITKKSQSSKPASSDSNKHKVNILKGDKKKKKPCKDPGRTSASEERTCAVQQTEDGAAGSSPDVEGKETLGELDGPGSSTPAGAATSSDDITSPPPASGEKKAKKKSNKSLVRKKSSNTNKLLKKERPHKDILSAAKTSTTKFIKVKTREVEGEVSETSPDSMPSRPGSSLNGKSATEEDKSTVCMDTLAQYGKKPYMRVPPTAYLDEKFTTMPKRRKELTLFQTVQRSPPSVQPCVTAALHRQRCANCFATFACAEELQSHLQLQRCSNLFGFDSDDEGE